MNFETVKPMLAGQFAGLTLINILFFIERMTRMGFFEALGRSVFAYALGLSLLALAYILAEGFITISKNIKASRKKKNAR